jgi:hypothetical protein
MRTEDSIQSRLIGFVIGKIHRCEINSASCTTLIGTEGIEQNSIPMYYHSVRITYKLLDIRGNGRRFGKVAACWNVLEMVL